MGPILNPRRSKASKLAEPRLANLDDDFIIGNRGKWLHDFVHFFKNGIRRRQGDPVTFVYHLHGGAFS